MTTDNGPLSAEQEEGYDDYPSRFDWARGPLLLAIVALAAGLLSILFLIEPSDPRESSVDSGFARDMMVHHSQAVEMAEIVRRNTNDDSLYALASEIALLQQFQIGQMRGWLAIWDLPEEGTELAMAWMGHPTSGRMPGMASSAQMEALATMPQAVMEIEFLRLMIPHHQAGIEMAQAALERSNRNEVRKLAQDILAGQGPELMLMQDMLTRRNQPRMAETSQMHGESESGSSETEHHSASSAVANDPKPEAAVRKALQFAPWTLAVFALAWLVLRPPLGERFDDEMPPSFLQIVAASALVAGAAFQAGFIVGQIEPYSTFALFSTLTAVIGAAVVIGAPSTRAAHITGLAVSVVLISMYVCLRIMESPGPRAAEGSSFAGVASTVFYAGALVSCILIWLVNQDDDEVSFPLSTT